MSCPFRASLYPQSHQLGVRVVVELEVELVEQVVVGRVIYETINRRARRCECLVVAETPQDTEPISPAVPLIQPMFQQGVHGTL